MMYKLLINPITSELASMVIRISDNTFIPFAPDNTDYQIYLKWLDGYELTTEGWVKTSEGNTPLPADE